MKKFIISAGFLFLFIPFVSAQSKDYKVVFDLTSKDTATHKTLVRWLDAISKGSPDAQLEVVLYGQSLGMITKGKSVAEEEIKRLLANKNITFRVCNATMERSNVTLDELIT